MSIDVGIQKKFFAATVIFSSDISDNGFGILGQKGFFDKFKISFDYRTKEIEIRD